MKNSNVVWDGHEGISRINPVVDMRPYWTFIAGFLLGVGECVAMIILIGKGAA